MYLNKRFINIALVFVSFIASISFIGWAIDSELLTNLVPGYIGMNPVTSILFLLASFSVYGLLRNEISWRRTGLVVTGIICITIVVKFLSYFSLISFNIDLVFFSEKLSRASIPNRMAPNTAFCFFLLGIALSLYHVQRKFSSWIQQALIFVVQAISFLAIVGYVYNIVTLYAVKSFAPMALNTALCFTLISFAVILSRSDRGITKLLKSPFSGGYIARTLFPIALLLPFLTGIVILLLERGGLINMLTGEALFVVGMTIVLAVISYYISSSLNSSDARRTALENSLRENEERFRRLTELGFEGIAISKDGVIVDGNEAFARLFGYSLNEMIGKHLIDLAVPENRKRILENIGKGREAIYEVDGLRKDGSTVPIEAHARMIRYNNEVLRVTAFSDLTERRNMEAYLRDVNEQLLHSNIVLQQSDKLKTELLNITVHDLKNPIGTIRTISNLFEDEPENVELIKEFAPVIARTANHMLSLISNLLESSYYESGNIRLIKEICELWPLKRIFPVLF